MKLTSGPSGRGPSAGFSESSGLKNSLSAGGVLAASSKKIVSM